MNGERQRLERLAVELAFEADAGSSEVKRKVGVRSRRPLRRLVPQRRLRRPGAGSEPPPPPLPTDEPQLCSVGRDRVRPRFGGRREKSAALSSVSSADSSSVAQPGAIVRRSAIAVRDRRAPARSADGGSAPLKLPQETQSSARQQTAPPAGSRHGGVGESRGGARELASASGVATRIVPGSRRGDVGGEGELSVACPRRVDEQSVAF